MSFLLQTHSLADLDLSALVSRPGTPAVRSPWNPSGRTGDLCLPTLPIQIGSSDRGSRESLSTCSLPGAAATAPVETSTRLAVRLFRAEETPVGSASPG